MAFILPLFPPSSPTVSDLGDDLLNDLLKAIYALQQQEVALRPTLVVDSWEAAYHTGIRVELAGAVFHVLSSLPLTLPLATFLDAMNAQLTARLAQLRSAGSPPYAGLAHGHFDGITMLVEVVDRCLELRLDSPTV